MQCRHCMLAPEKLHSELRVKGHACLSKVFAVVLEPTGTFAVITDGAPATPEQGHAAAKRVHLM